jgi:hypothetical protein
VVYVVWRNERKDYSGISIWQVEDANNVIIIILFVESRRTVLKDFRLRSPSIRPKASLIGAVGCM